MRRSITEKRIEFWCVVFILFVLPLLVWFTLHQFSKESLEQQENSLYERP